MSIEVQQLTRLYGSQKAVDNISFQVNKGEIVGFLGPNGAGKSTTMKIITGYLRPDAGKAIVCGIDVAASPIAAKKKIGYLPESNALYYEMYVREYLDFVGGTYRIDRLKEQIEKCIRTVGLLPEANKKIGQLSKGYKQRVGLAAALIHDPEVLILDEPTSGLDPNQIVEIREVIRSLGKDRTVLFSSHIMQEVQAICDRVVIISKGVIVADDQLSNLQGRTADHLVVGFKDAPDNEAFKALRGINRLEKLPQNRWAFYGSDIPSIRKEMMQLALDKNLSIVYMDQGGESLESVFRELTVQQPELAEKNPGQPG